MPQNVRLIVPIRVQFRSLTNRTGDKSMAKKEISVRVHEISADRLLLDELTFDEVIVKMQEYKEKYGEKKIVFRYETDDYSDDVVLRLYEKRIETDDEYRKRKEEEKNLRLEKVKKTITYYQKKIKDDHKDGNSLVKNCEFYQEVFRKRFPNWLNNPRKFPEIVKLFNEFEQWCLEYQSNELK